MTDHDDQLNESASDREKRTRHALIAEAQQCQDQLSQMIKRWADWRDAVMDLRELELGPAGMSAEELFADPAVSKVRELSPIPGFDSARATCRNLPEALNNFSPDRPDSH